MKQRGLSEGVNEEFALIAKLAQQLPEVSSRSTVGIGDDCAVVPLSELSESDQATSILLTCDSLVSGVHFRPEKIVAEDLGYKTLAVSLSDISAMGGKPRVATLSLTLNGSVAPDYLEGVYRGLGELAQQQGVMLVGGDTVSGKDFSLSLMLLGTCEKSAILRSGACVGDDVWVSGSVGGSGLGLAVQEEKLAQFEGAEDFVALHHRPPVLSRLGETLGFREIPSAMIDLSDGLLQDALHIACSSGVELEFDLKTIPFAKVPQGVCWESRQALTAGEDYQLLFCANPNASSALLELSSEYGLSKVGVVCEARERPGVFVISDKNERIEVSDWIGADVLGYSHF